MCDSRAVDSKLIGKTTIVETSGKTTIWNYGITLCNNDEDDDHVLVAGVRGFTDFDVNFLVCKFKQHIDTLLSDAPITCRILVTVLRVPFTDVRNTVHYTKCITAIVFIKRGSDSKPLQSILSLFPTNKFSSFLTIGHATLEIKASLKQFHNSPLAEKARKRNMCLCISGIEYITLEELFIGVTNIVKPDQVKSIFYHQACPGTTISFYLELDPNYLHALTLVAELDQHVMQGQSQTVNIISLQPPINKKYPFLNLFQITNSLLYNSNVTMKSLTIQRK